MMRAGDGSIGRGARAGAAVLAAFALALVGIPAFASGFNEELRTGYLESRVRLGMKYINGDGLPRDIPRGLGFLNEAAAADYAPAQFHLGFLHAAGRGIPQDYGEAVRWYRKAAEKGHAPAQHNLAVMFENGHGVARDPGEAARWYRMAADRGHAGAQFALGAMHAEGKGVPRDLGEAARRYRTAAEKGHAAAQHALGLMHAEGKGVARDPGEAARWYRMAADQGHPDARNGLGLLYESGRGVARNEREALSWYRLAAESGSASGKRNLDRLAERFRGPRLYGVHLDGGTRAAMRSALKASGLPAVREDDRFWFDRYDSSTALSGSTELAVGYTDAGLLAVAQYVIPDTRSAPRFREAAEMVRGKYGPPDSSLGSPGLGAAEHRWTVGNVVVRVQQGWPDATTYITYEVPSAKKRMDDEMAAADRPGKPARRGGEEGRY